MNAPADPPAEKPLDQGFRLGDLRIGKTRVLSQTEVGSLMSQVGM